MKKLIIDPGHGGKDPGAVAFGQKEKDWALKISQYQHSRFKELGANVDMTRYKDGTLDPVSRISRIKNKADFCISNHFNAFNGSARGVEVIHSIHASPVLSQRVADNIVDKTGLPLRRVFSRTLPNKKQDYYFMHRLTGSTQTLIIEYGFIDHSLDHEYYTMDTQLKIAAEAVIETMCRQLGIVYRPALLPNDNKPFALQNKKSQVKSKAQASSESLATHSLKNGVRSIHDGKLRFYNKPSWQDKDVFGYMTKGQVFPEVLETVSVGKGKQYKVRNSAGNIFYVTAHPNFVQRII